MTPDQVAARWKYATVAQQYELRRETEQVACPLPGCLAQPGEPCSYMGPQYDDETGATTGMVRIIRSAHLERVAVFTGGRLFRYTLRGLQ